VSGEPSLSLKSIAGLPTIRKNSQSGFFDFREGYRNGGRSNDGAAQRGRRAALPDLRLLHEMVDGEVEML
jgi:hypothetical protein